MNDIFKETTGWKARCFETDTHQCFLNISERISALNDNLFNEELTCENCIYIHENKTKNLDTVGRHTCLEKWNVVMCYRKCETDDLVKFEEKRITNCLCGMKLLNVFYIQRDNEICQIGSACINRFGTLNMIKDKTKLKTKREKEFERKTYKCSICFKQHHKKLYKCCIFQNIKNELIEVFRFREYQKISVECNICKNRYIDTCKICFEREEKERLENIRFEYLSSFYHCNICDKEVSDLDGHNRCEKCDKDITNKCKFNPCWNCRKDDYTKCVCGKYKLKYFDMCWNCKENLV